MSGSSDHPLRDKRGADHPARQVPAARSAGFNNLPITWHDILNRTFSKAVSAAPTGLPSLFRESLDFQSAHKCAIFHDLLDG
jgi:hypothetical protein